MQLGIDFGTTRTVVALCDQGNQPVIGFEDLHGDIVDHWPSVVACDGNRLEHGFAALARLDDPDWEVLRSMKRHLVGASADDPITLAGRTFELGTVLASFVAALRHALLHASNLPGPVDSPLRAHVGVPAGATSRQRMITMDAFTEAGFEVVGVFNEPSAAGLEYGHRYHRTLNSRRREVLVYDLGGGTFDVSVVHMAEGQHRVVAHAGDNRLGGDDFDDVLLTCILEETGLGPSALTVHERALLLDRCRQSKEALNPNSRRVGIEVRDDIVSIPVSTFYEACQPLLDRTLEVMRRVVPNPEDHALAGIYVVGGASDLPVVARRLRTVFPHRVRRSAYASAATAVGLALAHDNGPSTLIERFNRTFGVYRERDDGRDLSFDVLLTPDTEIQPDGMLRVRRYRAAHNVGLYRFVECDDLRDGLPAGDIQPWRRVRFPFLPELQQRAVAPEPVIPVMKLPEPGTLVEERYRVDRTGTVRLTITDLETGFRQEHQLHAPTAASAR